jgi:hydroxymethylpyrimidine/phosphomethylpyrimidine kinase
MYEQSAPPRVLTIAGSDSGGGAGIEADLKTFTALGVFGMAAITAVTSQNTVEVTGVRDMPADFVAEQIDTVARDIGIDAAKTGMLSNSAIVSAVADVCRRWNVPHLVVDPVMVAKSGDYLLRQEAVEAMRDALVPLAEIITPNVPELAELTGISVETPDDVRYAGQRMLDMGARCVLVKGGHMQGPQAVDYLMWHGGQEQFSAPRIDSRNTHGTGCTYSAAIAAGLAKGLPVPEAIRTAKSYLTEAIRRAFQIGQGHGPLNHFWMMPPPIR